MNYPELNSDFVRRMQAMLGEKDYADYLSSLSRPPVRIARLNPLKPVNADLLASELGAFPVIPENAKPGRSALHAAGAYYVQEPAAAAVANSIAPMLPRGARVLDMCAAPGGKVTAAAAARPDCSFVANEIVFSRAKILLSNVERMGLRNCTVTSLAPDELANRINEPFDAIIADVPCSGEGMLRKTEFRSDDLSDKAVEACANRARKILDECDRCLRAGGLLFFSTCTFNLAENEEQVKRLTFNSGYTPLKLPDEPKGARRGFGVDEAIRFFPQDGGGEGHFFCVLRKSENAEEQNRAKTREYNAKKAKKSGENAKIPSVLIKLCGEITAEKFDEGRMVKVGEGYEYVCENYAFSSLPALRRGMRIADVAGDRLMPHHHFATAANGDMALYSPDFAPTAAEIAAYLRGGEFESNEKSGFRILKVASLPLGLVKISGGVAKNKYPKGLRLN